MGFILLGLRLDCSSSRWQPQAIHPSIAGCVSLPSLAAMMSVLSVSAGKSEERFAVINIVPGLLVVAVFVVIAVVGLTLDQRIVPSHLRQQHNDVAD